MGTSAPDGITCVGNVGRGACSAAGGRGSAGRRGRGRGPADGGDRPRQVVRVAEQPVGRALQVARARLQRRGRLRGRARARRLPERARTAAA